MLHIELPIDQKGNVSFGQIDCYEIRGAISGLDERRRRLNGRLPTEDQDQLDELKEVLQLAQERGFCLDRPSR